MRFVCSLIVVKDIAKSTLFYRDLLGQKVKFDFGENVSFEGGFAIHLESHYAKLLGASSPKISYGSHDFELYFESDAMDEIHNRLVKNDVPFIHHIVEQPWKQRVFRFYDPDNHVVEVGETMESVVLRLQHDGLSVEQIQQAASMPVEFVHSVIA